MTKLIHTVFVFVLSTSTALVCNAAVYSFSYNGLFSVLDSVDNLLVNQVGRVDIAGDLSYDDVANVGTFSVLPFTILSSSLLMESTPAVIQVVGDGLGNTGALIQSDMNFTTDGSAYSVALEWDATGFFNAIASGLPAGVGILGQFAELHGDVLTKAEFILPSPFPTPFDPPVGLNTTTVNIGSSAPVSDSLGDLNGLIPVGPAPFATTTPLGNTLPITSGPFPGFYFNLDITDMALESIGTSPVPLPAAFWLFLSGFGALLGLARVKR